MRVGDYKTKISPCVCVSVCGLWTQSAESSVWGQNSPRMLLDNAGRNLGMTVLHRTQTVVTTVLQFNGVKKMNAKYVRTCIWWIVFVFQLKFYQQLKDSSAKWKHTAVKCDWVLTALTPIYTEPHRVPCIGCQAAEHMREGGQSEGTSLLHQQRVFIRRLLGVVLERNTLPPKPVKLALLELVPHWGHKGNI